MNVPPNYNRSDSHRPFVTKHVTIACDACRRKRTKCDGQVPCPQCRSTQESCTYTSIDRRRQRHEPSAVSRPADQQSIAQTAVTDTTVVAASDDDDTQPETLSVTGAHIGPTTQKNTQYNITDTQGYPKLQNPAAQSTYNVSEASVHGSLVKTRTLASNSSHRSDKVTVSNDRAMKDMQGQFEARAAVPQHNPETYPTKPPRRRLLPRNPASAHSLDVRSRDRKHNRQGNHQQLHQFVWRARRTGYAVPGYTRAFGNMSFSSSIRTNGYPANVQAHQAMNISAPDHLVFPLISVDNSPLGRAIVDFQRLGRRLIAEGTPPSQVADTGPIDVTLFFRERLPQDPENASAWCSEMLRAFRGTFSDRLLLASAVCVTSLMRWFIVPTPENYYQIPPIMRPTQMQKFKPHPPWVDVMIFPSFRNALVEKQRDWVEPCIRAKWDLLWSNPLEQALVRHDQTQQVFVTADFTAYISDSQNWLIQRSILEDFSELQGSEMNIPQE